MSEAPTAEKMIWHLPEDRMPPYNTQILLTMRWGDSKPEVYVAYRRSTDHRGERYYLWGTDREVEASYKVLAWMHIPSPYNG